MSGKSDINKRNDSGKAPAGGKPKILLNREELRQAYRLLIKQFQSLNDNGAYDTIISDLLNRLTQMSASEFPESSTKYPSEQHHRDKE